MNTDDLTKEGYILLVSDIRLPLYQGPGRPLGRVKAFTAGTGFLCEKMVYAGGENWYRVEFASVRGSSAGGSTFWYSRSDLESQGFVFSSSGELVDHTNHTVVGAVNMDSSKVEHVVTAMAESFSGTMVIVAKKVSLTPAKKAKLLVIKTKRLALRTKAKKIIMKIKAARMKVAKSSKKETRAKYRKLIKALITKKKPYLDELKKLRLQRAKILGIKIKKHKKRKGSHRKHKHHMVKVRGSYVEAARRANPPPKPTRVRNNNQEAKKSMENINRLHFRNKELDQKGKFTSKHLEEFNKAKEDHRDKFGYNSIGIYRMKAPKSGPYYHRELKKN